MTAGWGRLANERFPDPFTSALCWRSGLRCCLLLRKHCYDKKPDRRASASAGTYFPPHDSFGRPGFATVLKKVADVWQTRKAEVEAQSASVIEQIEAATRPEGE